MPSQPVNTISTYARQPVLNQNGTMDWAWLRQLSRLLSADNNLSDLADVAVALENLGFTGGSSVTVPLAKITGGGSDGSMVVHTWANGYATILGIVQPT